MKKSLLTFTFLQLILVFGYAQIQINNFEFEDNLAITIAPGTDTLWQIGEPAKVLFDAASSLPNAILTDSVNTYPIEQSRSFELTLDESTLWDWPYIQIDWSYKMDVETGVDGGIIETSYDDGLTWKNVFSDPDFRPFIVGDFQTDTLFNGQVGLTGEWDWSWIAICWGTFEGELPEDPTTIRVRYTFVSDSIDTQQEGWMMDDFQTQTQIVGSTTNQNILKIKVYPNPTRDALFFDLEELGETDLTIDVYNNSGQLVVSQKLNAFIEDRPSIATKHLAVGQYSVLIRSAEGVFRSSFVKVE